MNETLFLIYTITILTAIIIFLFGILLFVIGVKKNIFVNILGGVAGGFVVL